MKELVMGNEAIALGALAAGVQVVTGYPGTPSTEVLETVAKRNPGWVYVEWSVNEKAGLEVAAGAAYAGARAMVTMKQVGLNVASDPLMCLNYIGVKGGMVIYVADDPGPISSQTEQDTRHFAEYAKIPVFDVTSPEEAYEMVQEAFKLSEAIGGPVILRATTRICHACATVDIGTPVRPAAPEGFVKDPKWVIFPRLSYQNKMKLEARAVELSQRFCTYSRNELLGEGPIGIACGGVSFAYVMDAIRGNESHFTVLKVATPYPFPNEFARGFLRHCERVIVFEELDPVIEDALTTIKGNEGDLTPILGKRDGTVPNAGELSAMRIAECLEGTFGVPSPFPKPLYADVPQAPSRPPVLCAGCPHRAAFYAVKKAMEGRKAIFCGDIGCYTLGNAAPLDMVDTCLCMGAGITLAQGLMHADPEAVHFAFVGDSTFFAAGMTGVLNAVYNDANMVLVVLDNATTAMTGHQPHPGRGVTMMNTTTRAANIEAILTALGVECVQTIDPLDYEASVAAVRAAADASGVRAIVFRSPCIAVVKPHAPSIVETAQCVGCRKCIRELGCPALAFDAPHKKAMIDPSLCTGCQLCAQICPTGCIRKGDA